MNFLDKNRRIYEITLDNENLSDNDSNENSHLQEM